MHLQIMCVQNRRITNKPSAHISTMINTFGEKTLYISVEHYTTACEKVEAENRINKATRCWVLQESTKTRFEDMKLNTEALVQIGAHHMTCRAPVALIYGPLKPTTTFFLPALIKIHLGVCTVC